MRLPGVTPSMAIPNSVYPKATRTKSGVATIHLSETLARSGAETIPSSAILRSFGVVTTRSLTTQASYSRKPHRRCRSERSAESASASPGARRGSRVSRYLASRNGI